ncbi:MAG: tRNA (guanosine(37)-N1)-methyltransferase TrmD [Armatimonadetes bacterium]|nr:tRNA (guanosine(37)-N1)-methyltransferase TrmD [Armatimonadota bacterium]
MNISLRFITVFPEWIDQYFQFGVVARAISEGLASYEAIDLRQYAPDARGTVDERPFGGKPGMLLQCGPIEAAIQSLPPQPRREIVFFEPWGESFSQQTAADLARSKDVVFVCGRYEGIDARMHERHATRVLSLGDYVLTGAELPAMIVADAVIRLLPGVLGDPESLQEDSHSDGLLGYPQYTRPQEFEGLSVPDVLLSGNHQAVDDWQRTQQLKLTRQHRPDLFCTAPLSKRDLDLLK